MSKLILCRAISQQTINVAFNRIKTLDRIHLINRRSLTTDEKITIDGITKNLQRPTNPFNVPQKFCKYYFIITLGYHQQS